MSNMSYCRFQNTDGDLADCADDLERRATGQRTDEHDDPIDPLTNRERRCAQSLIERCADVVRLVMEERGLADLDDLTTDEIEKFIDGLQDDVEEACADELDPTTKAVRP